MTAVSIQKSMSKLPILQGYSAFQEEGFNEYLQRTRIYPVLSKEDEYEFAKKVYYTRDKKAAEVLITSHLRLVAKIAMNMYRYGTSIMDLISEGSIGLMRAVDKFNPELGYRFATYAMLWIKATMGEFILRNWSLVRIGTSKAHKKLFFGLEKAKRKLRSLSEATGSLSIHETKLIAESVGVSSKDVEKMESRMLSRDISLDQPLDASSTENSYNLLQQLEETSINQEEALAEREEQDLRHKLLQQGLATLSTREQEILKARILQEKPATLDELSNIYNISGERVRQIESRAIEKLKEYCTAIV